MCYEFSCGPGSSVGIANDYRLEGPGSNSTALILTYELYLFDALCSCMNMPVLSVCSVVCML